MNLIIKAMSDEVQYAVPGLQEYLLGKVRQALPRLPNDGRLKIASVLCGDNLRGKIASELLHSVMDDQVAKPPTLDQQPAPKPASRAASQVVPQAPAGDKFDGIKAKKRRSKSATGPESSDIEIVKVRKRSTKL